MKFLHISDLHIGKRVNGYSMTEDQKYILDEILAICDDRHPDAILVSGDIYDRAVPSEEAVSIFESFLKGIAQRYIPAYIISGNHDSAERLAFCSEFIDLSGIHISPVFSGNIKPFATDDEFGRVNIWMLPFIKPADVRRYFENDEILSFTDAVRCVVRSMEINEKERNIILAHQFVTGAVRSDSEERYLGGLDNVEADVFDQFDYVALGHIHGPQKFTRETMRYSGSPLKYSFSEIKHTKSAVLVTLAEKGNTQVELIPLKPLHDIIEKRGLFDDFANREDIPDEEKNSYIRFVLNDEDDIPDVMNRLKKVYPFAMKVDYDNTRTRSEGDISDAENIQEKTPGELFGEFFLEQNGQEMSESQKNIVMSVFEKLGREEI